MKRIVLLLFMLIGFVRVGVAQTPDSLGIRPQKPLPPSILAELRRGERNRTLVYHDTVKASDIERQHAADTAASGTYVDSAITLMDTAVSLSHKEWLDSALVEIPEMHRIGSRVHFEYPPSIMTQSEMTKVAFDSTILVTMNPVSREQLPFFDQSPIPMPLPLPDPFEAFVEVGAGNVEQPIFRGFFMQRFSPHLSFSASGDFESHNELPLPSFFTAGGNLMASLGADPALRAHEGSELTALLNYTTRDIKFLNDSGKTRSMSLFRIGADIEGESGALQYAVSAIDRQWDEDILPRLGEATQDLALKLGLNIGSDYTLGLDATYLRSSLTDSAAQNADRFALTFGTNKSATLYWNAGLAILGGSEVSSSFAPVAHARLALNPRWEIGASLDPKASLSSMTTLTATNPFYRSLSGRGSVADKLNIAGYMTYALSSDDNLRVEAAYIARDHEPVFESLTLSDSSITQIALPYSTKRLSLTGSGNFLLFARDVLTASLTIMSATNTDSSRTMAYEPTMRFEAAYRFNSISNLVSPLIRLRSIVLSDRSINMLDIEADANIWKTVSAKLALNNIMDGRSDYWLGYNESPRSIVFSVRYGF